MRNDAPRTPQDVVNFWREAGSSNWFTRSDAFDHECERFRPLHMRASRRELDDWMRDAEGALALVLLLDQFPRNIFRDSAHVYATDLLARHFAAQAVDRGLDAATDAELRAFFYMPFLHSESMDDQRRSLELHARLPGPDADRWARHHAGIIERFGRFPHRNDLLGRENTAEEQAFLDAGGFGA